jgi:hypothetical protein
MQLQKQLDRGIAIFHLGPPGKFEFRATRRPQYEMGAEQAPREIGEEWVLEVITQTAPTEREVTREELVEFANCQDTVEGAERYINRFGPPFFMAGSSAATIYAATLGQWKGLQLQFRVTWDRFIGGRVENDFTRSALGKDFPETWKAQPPWTECVVSGKFALRGRTVAFVADTHFAALVAKLLMVANTGKLRKCRNPECSGTPYFIAEHGKAQFCGEECGRWGQRQAKLKYWKEHVQQPKGTKGNREKKLASGKGGERERRTSGVKKTR